MDHLTIEAGTQVHFHSGSGLWVWRGGQITVNGTASEKVVFQGDRLEHVYDDVPGQWDVIRINDGPAGQDNVFTHAIIKNNILGIQATPVPLLFTEDQANEVTISDNWLELNNVIIQDNSDISLWAKNTKVKAENCLFANAGRFTGLFQGAGEYDINHCTFANYWSESTRNEPGFFISNRYPNEVNSNVTIIHDITGASTIRNCIFYGNNFEEFAYDFETSLASVDLRIFGSLYKINETNLNSVFFTDNTNNINAGWSNTDPDFVDISVRDFHLTADPISFAANKGVDFLDQDLDGNIRDNDPDLGCYELQP